MIDQYDIVQMGVDDLLPDPRNPMEHDDAEMQRLVGSVSEHGFLQPVVWNKRTGHIVGGHARVEAARATGLETVPAVVVDFDDTKEAAVNIALNGAYGHWDDAKLTDLLKELDEAGYDLDATGLEPFRIEELLGNGSGGLLGADPDDVPEPPDEPITKRGDVILLGRHRLMCGDSSDSDGLHRLFEGANASLLLTDPPYGVDYGDLVRGRQNQKAGGWDDIHGDSLSDEELASLLTATLGGMGAHTAFVWHPPGARRFLFWQALEANGWRISQEIVWVKNALVFGRADYQWRHEPCLYARREGAPRQGDRTQTTVWEENKPADSRHPTQKPVGLFARPIRNHTEAGDIVFDPFAGSGTAFIAAEQEGRICHGVELDPKYCDVIVDRWEQFTGKTAERPALSLASFES